MNSSEQSMITHVVGYISLNDDGIISLTDSRLGQIG